MARNTVSDEAQELLDLDALRRLLVLQLRLVDRRRLELAGYESRAA